MITSPQLNSVPLEIFVQKRLNSLLNAVLHWAHGVVVSHPLRMRKALGSNRSVSIFRFLRGASLLCDGRAMPCRAA